MAGGGGRGWRRLLKVDSNFLVSVAEPIEDDEEPGARRGHHIISQTGTQLA